ncbi:MAG: J domain-containing protein [Spirochaetales bacterium]|nr:J domain-containing protein [Spirochaetales bacterium]
MTVSRVKASLALQLVPEIAPESAPESALLIMPGPEQIKKAYRRLSRIYHPDSGGDSPLFITIGESRDLLLGR